MTIEYLRECRRLCDQPQGDPAWRLEPMQAFFTFSVLVLSEDRGWAPRDVIGARLWGNEFEARNARSADGRAADKYLAQMACRIGQKLRPFDIHLKSYFRRGWFFDDASIDLLYPGFKIEKEEAA